MKMFNTIKNGAKAHAPLIIAIGGLVAAGATVVFAVKEAPKVKLALENKKIEKEEAIREKLPEDKKNEPIEVELSVLDKAKVITKHCWPAIIAAITCIASTGISQWMCGRRIAAAQFAKEMTQKAFDSYVDETVKKIGNKKEEEIRENVVKKEIEKDKEKVKNGDVIVTGKGDLFVKDLMTGATFYTTMDKLRKAENTVNSLILEGEFISINDFYDELGVDHTPLGDDVGFEVRMDDVAKNSFLKLVFSPKFDEDDQLYVGISYSCIDRASKKTIHPKEEGVE